MQSYKTNNYDNGCQLTRHAVVHDGQLITILGCGLGLGLG